MAFFAISVTRNFCHLPNFNPQSAKRGGAGIDNAQAGYSSAKIVIIRELKIGGNEWQDPTVSLLHGMRRAVFG